MGLTVEWVLINLVFPVAVAPVLVSLASAFLALTPDQKRNTRLLRTVQEGQLGWVSLAWSAAAVYQAWDYLEHHQNFYRFVSLVGPAEGLLVLAGGFISVGGTMAASDEASKQKRYAIWSIVTACASGFVWAVVQFKTT
ncbi:hypothetical protein AAGS40_30105 (plasmid) [Paraburkholderia sp. PREW-6R]|uniref:hypothetical protein n=1 Tax=Paraburkholderia sp. PREW-6R TaxID=3141544 RepID=UPI0031F49C44